MQYYPRLYIYIKIYYKYILTIFIFRFIMQSGKNFLCAAVFLHWYLFEWQAKPRNPLWYDQGNKSEYK